MEDLVYGGGENGLDSMGMSHKIHLTEKTCLK